MKRVLAIAALSVMSLVPAVPAPAQGTETVRRVVVYGNDPCPEGSGGEIVVCARRPENDRYRIPEELRTAEPDPQSDSWAERAESLEYVGQSGIQSCSPVGPGGATGCLDDLLTRWRAARDSRDTAVPPQ